MRPVVVACVVFLLLWAALLLVPASADVDARALAYFPADFLRDTKDLTWWLHVVSGLRAVARLAFFWALLLSPLGARWQRVWACRSVVVEAVVVAVVVVAGALADTDNVALRRRRRATGAVAPLPRGSSSVPSSVLPSPVLPSSVLPSSVLPSSSLPSSSLPTSPLPRPVPHGAMRW
jgi:hypothetical protein